MRFITPDFKGRNPGHYSPGVISGNRLHVSGQLSIDPDTRQVPEGDVREHTRLALSNVERVLLAAGCRREDVIICRVYTPCMDQWGAINEEYARFFGEHRPARAVVAVPELHFGCLVEIECEAEVPDCHQ